MKKIIAIVLCLILVCSMVGCGEKVNLDDEPTVSGKVIDWWGSSVTIEVTESSIDAIKEGALVFFEQEDIDNFRDWIDLSIDDRVQVIFDGDHILTGGSPISLEKVYKISELIEPTNNDNKPYTYNVAYANWTEDNSIYSRTLNGKMMQSNSILHLPVYKFDTKKELDSFKSMFKDTLTIDQGYDEVPSFDYITAAYDDSFFSKYSLILSYVPASSGSCRYGVSDVYCEDKAFCMYIEQLNDHESYTDDMAGWFVVVEVNKEDIADCTSFDAQLGTPLE